MFRRRPNPDVIVADENGVPDLARLRQSAEAYYALHLEAVREADFHKRVHAQWGLVARGADALPFLMTMLRSSCPESREDAAAALARLGTSDPEVVAGLLDALRDAVSHEERDSVLLCLGALRARAAVPALAEMVRDPAVDGDTRHLAAQVLGQVVRRRFDKQPDPVAAAVAWLDAHPTATA